MGKIRKAFTDSLKWIIRNLYEFAFVLVIASMIEAIHSLFSSTPQDCMVWAWTIGFLGISFFLFRMSLGRKAVRIFVLALLNMLFVSIWCIEFLRGLLFAPVLAGKALGIVMLIFIAINAVVVITGLDKQELDKKKKLALRILLGGSVLCALLTFFSPEWVDILVLDAATIVAILLFKSQTAQKSELEHQIISAKHVWVSLDSENPNE